MATDAFNRLTNARTTLIIKQPFFGTLATQLKMREMDDDMRSMFTSNGMTPTLAVDGRHLFYAPEWVMSMSMALLQSAWAHEVGHCIFDHIKRRNGRDPAKWNAAGDYNINDMLKKCDFQIGENWLLDSRYTSEMTVDHIYNLLPDSPRRSQDIVLDASDDPDDTQQTLSDQWKSVVVQAAAAAKKSGRLPGSLERFINEMIDSSVDWRTVLRRFMTDRSKNDFAWSRFNRMYASLGLSLPSLYSESMGSFVVVTDDSGSIDGPVLAAFDAEIQAGRAAAMPEHTLHISCDSRINHTAEYGATEPFKMISKGGGGTDFRPPFEYIDKHGLTPTCLIYLTDGYGPFPQHPPSYPVLWCMTTDIQPPWGEVVKVKL